MILTKSVCFAIRIKTKVLKHKSVIHVDHVELDEDVVHVCRQHFPWGEIAWNDPRVTLHIQDGAAFVANAPRRHYDVVIQDSSDPYVRNEDGTIETLPSYVLFTNEHFQHVKRILNDGGMFCMQSETFHLPGDFNGVRSWRKQILNAGFELARYGSICTKSYPLGQIGFLLCKSVGPQTRLQSIQKRFDEIVSEGKATTYYWPKLQECCFALPLWVHKTLYGDSFV